MLKIPLEHTRAITKTLPRGVREMVYNWQARGIPKLAIVLIQHYPLYAALTADYLAYLASQQTSD